MKRKIISERWSEAKFWEQVEGYEKKGYRPKYESFQVTFSDSGGVQYLVIVMVKGR